MPAQSIRTAKLLIGVLGALLLILVGFGRMVGETTASFNDSEFATATFVASAPGVLDVEGSPDGVTWTNDAQAVLDMRFDADELALQVGEENAVYAPLHLRAAAESNLAATATVTEDGLPAGDSFADALQSEIYADTTECSATSVDGASPIATGGLQGQLSSPFDIEAPLTDGEPGPVQSLCVKVWLDNNNFLLGGTQSDVLTARWVVDVTAVEA